MTPQFRRLEGGLFSEVTKADIGDASTELIARGGCQMAWADPFFPDASTPPSVMDAMQKALASGTMSHYEPPIGSLALRKVVAEKLRRVNGIVADPARNILITPGSDSGLLFAMMPFLGPGDEVLIPDPSYPSNQSNARLLGAVPVPFRLAPEDNYQISRAALDEALTPRTKMVLISHPNNPTSTVFRRECLEELSEFCVANDLILVCDQAFEDHVFDGIEMISPATLPGMWERTVTTFSISKGLGLSGFRVGYIVADDRIMDAFYASAVSVVGTTNTLAQVGAIAALEDPTIIPAYSQILDRRRRVFYDIVSQVPGVKLRLPESGILAWLDVSEIGSSRQVVSYLASEEGIMVNEGVFYGDEGRGHIRVVFGVLADDDQATSVYKRLAAALSRLAKAS